MSVLLESLPIGEHYHLSLKAKQGINPDPVTYEWCICGEVNPVACTFSNVYCADYYQAEFEPCKCACHKSVIGSLEPAQAQTVSSKGA